MIEESCTYTIRSRYRELSEKERKIADYILANLNKAVHPSIEELSEAIGISESTMVRFVRKLGYSGYQRFRIALATETVTPSSRVYETPIDSDGDDVELVFNSAISTLELTGRSIDRKEMAKAADLIVSSGRLLLFGTGGSNITARDAFHKILRTGLECTADEDYHMQLMLASQANRGCAALIVSHTGENMDTLAIGEELKDRECPVIVITSNRRSPLARIATIVLPVRVAATSYASEAFSARIAHLVLIDALYVEIMKRLGSGGIAHLDAMRKVISRRMI